MSILTDSSGNSKPRHLGISAWALGVLLYLIMKIIHSEFSHSYKTYQFGYTLYAQREAGDHIEPIYEQGFLPYSGNKDIRDMYYMARSARIALGAFSSSSENRRIIKKFQDVSFTKKIYPAKHFIHNKNFFDFCLTYFEERHGAGIFSAERLMFILKYSPETYVIEYCDTEEKPVAYVITIQSKNIDHYWFSFYRLELAYKSFGVWLMLDSILSAQESKKKYLYLGTVYEEKALYKTNFSPLEFWNGNEWVADVKELKRLAKTDRERTFD